MLEDMLTAEGDDEVMDNENVLENGIETELAASDLLTQQLHEATVAVLATTEKINKAKIKSQEASNSDETKSMT